MDLELISIKDTRIPKIAESSEAKTQTTELYGNEQGAKESKEGSYGNAKEGPLKLMV